MPTRITRLIPVTDERGKMLLDEDTSYEPEPGSIVLTSGHYGTAWQRHFADGLWYRSGPGLPKTWHDLCLMRNVVLVYDANARPATKSLQRAESRGGL